MMPRKPEAKKKLTLMDSNLWATFAASALAIADGDSEKQMAADAAKIADCLLVEYQRRA
jgi:hypothetical protein